MINTNNLFGKKLLILAGSVHEMDLVRRAQELGVYTIVTDYYDTETSPAKKIADEYWNISWNDIDSLTEKCIEEGIDGVTAGYSEFTVECLIKLCSRLKLPCYCTEAQLEITRHKILFKDECKKYHVPVVREYAIVEDVEHYPVIVKPVDRGGSIGISVATNKNELKKAYAYAMEMSVCKQVIIEDFIYKGTKFDAYYAISNGEITLLSTSDTINATTNGFEKVVQSGWTLPSRFHKAFEEKVDAQLRDMIRGMGIKYGFLFFSGFADGDDFVFFETGFRLSGGHMYKYFSEINFPDIQDIFIFHALTGNTDGLVFDNSLINREIKGLVINFYAKEGCLTATSGLDRIGNLESCRFCLPMCRIGQQCHEDKAILTKLAMVHLYNKSTEKICNDAEKTYLLYKALGQNGEDLVYDRIEKSTINHSWD